MQSLRDELRDLSNRVDELEKRAQKSSSSTNPTTESDGFWALNELQSRLSDDQTTSDGAVMLVGSLTLAEGGPIAWQQTIGTSGLIESDWSEQAAVFAALGHPVRVELLRQILSGVHHTADLAAIESLGTTGQLHHHLRQLVATGWVRQTGRGSYEIPPARIVPLLICIASAER